MMLKLANVTKKYGNNLVLDNIHLNFNNPEGVYGILGRNGVGKTTLMKIIFNMITDYEGEVELEGKNVKNNDDALQQIVFAGGEVNNNNSLFQGKLKKIVQKYDLLYENFDVEYANSLLQQFEINPKSKFSALSTGNKTLVQNIFGLATRAPITILDEPTNGLDSVNRHKFFQIMMEDYAAYPRLFILSTHLIQEVENYLTDVVILKDSKILIDDSIETIQAKAYEVSNYRLTDKRILKETSLGSNLKQEIFDKLSDAEIHQIKGHGGEVAALGLQRLFNALVEK